MLQTYVRIDKTGVVISSGADKQVAVKSFKHTACVNDGEELSIGSVCASAVEIIFFDQGGGLSLTAGDVIEVVRGDSGDSIGKFIIEQPTRPTANTMKVTGYDFVTKLDVDLTTWLNGLNDWPYTVREFAPLVAQVCGLRFNTNWNTTPNADFEIQKLVYSGVTGRKLMKWLGEICARFCYADGDVLRFGWYKDSNITFSPSGDRYYFEGGLTFEEYRTEKIGSVQIQLAESESGALWPEAQTGTNSYIIRGNAILQRQVTQNTMTVLANILASIQNDSYTPCKVVVPASLDVKPGHKVTIVDRNGRNIVAYIMTKVTEGQKDTIECTGSARRDGTKNLNSSTLVTQNDLTNATQQVGQQSKDYANQIGKGAEIYADEAARLAAQDAVRRQTQADIFKKLTNDGELQGLFYQDGKWYINAEYVQIYNLVASAIVSGILESVDGKTYFNLNTGEIVANSGEYKIVLNNGNISLLDSIGNTRMTLGRQTIGNDDAFVIMCYNALGKSVLGLGVNSEGDAKLYAKQYGGSGFAGFTPAWKFADDGSTYLAAE